MYVLLYALIVLLLLFPRSGCMRLSAAAYLLRNGKIRPLTSDLIESFSGPGKKSCGKNSDSSPHGDPNGEESARRLLYVFIAQPVSE